MKILILFTMLFLHIVDDYYLQGILAKLKQKSWWEQNVNDSSELYKHDYLVALIEHAFSWAFMILLPFLVCMILSNKFYITEYTTLFIGNWIIHAAVDNEKANNQTISLLTDQLIHVIQIIGIWLMVFYVYEVSV